MSARKLAVLNDAVPASLQQIADSVDMRVVAVAHEGWPLGLLADAEGSAWRVGTVVELRPLSVNVTRTALHDLNFELRRLFAIDLAIPKDADGIDTLPGLELAEVATIRIPSLPWAIVVDVGKSVAVLAEIPVVMTRVADSGQILRVLERAGALLRSEP